MEKRGGQLRMIHRSSLISILGWVGRERTGSLETYDKGAGNNDGIRITLVLPS
jgi:hypothetical protein